MILTYLMNFFLFGMITLQWEANSLGNIRIDIKTKRCSCGLDKTFRGRIMGGVTAEENEFPWQVAIYLYDSFICGGSLINDRYILTAAHCFKKRNRTAQYDEIYDQKFMKFILGRHDLGGTMRSLTEVRTPIKTVLHGFYNPISLINDIAISKFANPITADMLNVLPICLPPALNKFRGFTAIVSGWGRHDIDQAEGDIPPEIQLLKTAIKVLPMNRCAKVYSNFNDSSMICAASLGRDSCQGDSGGPLTTKLSQNKYTQIGIVSYGDGCGDINYPGIYTRINKFINWIMYHTSDGLFCNK